MNEPFTNYFNYFTEIEEHFQRARGTSLFLLSPLDWALIESWKNSGVPLEAVLRGIDAAFEKWRAKKSRVQMVNSLAFCSQAVLVETQRLADATPERPPKPEAAAPFPDEELKRYILSNAAAVRQAGGGAFARIADALDEISNNLPALSVDLESLEQRLNVLEQQMIALAQVRQSEEAALGARQQLETYLRPYRGKMTAPQIAMLEIQFRERSALESAGLPRLSLFYFR